MLYLVGNPEDRFSRDEAHMALACSPFQHCRPFIEPSALVAIA